MHDDLENVSKLLWIVWFPTIEENKMVWLVHMSKATALLILGSLYHEIPLQFFLGHDRNFILNYMSHVVYFLLLFWVVHRYVISYRYPKVPETDFNVCIIGAGVSGICIAIKLKEMGVKFRMIEKSTDLGGTWWENLYPGCGCDVHSHLYSFSFAPNPGWSKVFSEREEIQCYLRRVADDYGITEQIEFGRAVRTTNWSAETNQWVVTLDDGEVFSVNALIPCLGQLNIPRTPAIEGSEGFRGDAFHSAQWKKGYDPTGKRVAVIGTGASAVQIVPTIAPKVNELCVFQRTPCWVSTKDTSRYPAWLRLLFKIYPPVLYLYRFFLYWFRELLFVVFFRIDSPFRKVVAKQIEDYMRSAVKNPELAQQLIPKYDMGCKRITPSAEYLQAFNRDNISLVTDPIKGFTENGIETKDGTIYPVDTVVYATGFYPAKSYNTFRAYGLSGTKNPGTESSKTSLQDEWGETPNAYLGITYPGYPNMFLMYGVGSNLGHHSVIHMIECQATYIVDAISQMIGNGIKSVNLRKEVNVEYQEWVQKCMQNKAFNSPTCTSWYKNSKGVNYALFPNSCTQYWWITRKADLTKYSCET